MENEPQLRMGSPAKAALAPFAESPPGSDDWCLKAHGGSGVSRIPKPAPLTPSDQGIKGKVGAPPSAGSLNGRPTRHRAGRTRRCPELPLSHRPPP